MKTFLIILGILTILFVAIFWDGIVEVWNYYKDNPLWNMK